MYVCMLVCVCVCVCVGCVSVNFVDTDSAAQAAVISFGGKIKGDNSVIQADGLTLFR